MPEKFSSVVLLRSPARFTTGQFLDRLRHLTAPVGISAEIDKESQSGRSIIVMVAGVPIAVAPQNDLVPAEALESALKKSIAWPEARQAYAAHRASAAVICLIEPDGPEQALHMAMATSFVAAAVLLETDSFGLMWGTGDIMVSKAGWLDAVQSITRRSLPVADWVSLLWVKGADDGIGLVTCGASAFLGREIEMLPSALSPVEIAGKVFNFLHYMLMHNPVINENDTIGESADERIRVNYRPRGTAVNQPVMQLTVERDTPAPAASPAAAPATTQAQAATQNAAQATPQPSTDAPTPPPAPVNRIRTGPTPPEPMTPFPVRSGLSTPPPRPTFGKRGRS